MALYDTIATLNASCIAANKIKFNDGTDGFSAGPVYASYGVFIDDLALSMCYCPQLYSEAQVANILAKFHGARLASGAYPITVKPDQTVLAYSGYDNYQKYPTGDGWIQFGQLLHLLYRKNGSLVPYQTYIAGYKAALALMPRNPTTKLITVNLGDEYVSGMAFMEYMRLTGDVANANVWYAQNCKHLAAMATAAGDTSNASFFGAEYTTVVAAIKANLIDPNTGMLWAALGQCKQIDITSSCLAVYFGLLTDAQNLAIASWLDSNYSTIVNASGYILQTVGGWQVIGSIPANGKAPYGSAGYSATQYQGGYWSHHAGWFVYALNLVNPAKVQTWLATWAAGVDPKTEYFNVGSSAAAGTTPNLESTSGAYWAANRFLLDHTSNQFQGHAGWQG